MVCYHFNAGQHFFGLQGFFLVLGGPLSGLQEGEREIREFSSSPDSVERVLRYSASS